MTDTVHSVIVVLDHNIREDDLESTLGTLRMIKGVLSVQPITDTIDALMARERAKSDLGQRVLDAVVAEIRKP